MVSFGFPCLTKCNLFFLFDIVNIFFYWLNKLTWLDSIDCCAFWIVLNQEHFFWLVLSLLIVVIGKVYSNIWSKKLTIKYELCLVSEIYKKTQVTDCRSRPIIINDLPLNQLNDQLFVSYYSGPFTFGFLQFRIRCLPLYTFNFFWELFWYSSFLPINFSRTSTCTTMGKFLGIFECKSNVS